MMFPAGKKLSQTRLLRFIMVNSNRTSLKQQFRVFAKKWLLADFCNINVFYLDQRPLSHIIRRVPGCSSRDLTEIWRKTLDAASEATVNRRPKKNHFMRILENISRRKWKDLFRPLSNNVFSHYYISKMLHLRSLTGFCIRLCVIYTQLRFTCSKSTIETLEKRMKYVQS